MKFVIMPPTRIESQADADESGLDHAPVTDCDPHNIRLPKHLSVIGGSRFRQGAGFKLSSRAIFRVACRFAGQPIPGTINNLIRSCLFLFLAAIISTLPVYNENYRKFCAVLPGEQ